MMRVSGVLHRNVLATVGTPHRVHSPLSGTGKQQDQGDDSSHPSIMRRKDGLAMGAHLGRQKIGSDRTFAILQETPLLDSDWEKLPVFATPSNCELGGGARCRAQINITFKLHHKILQLGMSRSGRKCATTSAA